MPSNHTWKAIAKARSKGAWAGDPNALPLWEMPKRELVEIAIRLGAMANGTCENYYEGIQVALEESRALRANEIV